MTPEKKIQNKIIKYLKDLQKEGVFLFYERRQAGGLSYKKGLPDIWVVLNGKHIEIEIKAKDKKRSALQFFWQDYFERIKVLYLCTDDYEEFKKFFEILLKI